jgi:hypothetical protein
MAPDTMTPEKWATVERLMAKLIHDRPGMNWTIDRFSDGMGGTRGWVTEIGGSGWRGDGRMTVIVFDSNDELIERLTKYAGE